MAPLMDDTGNVKYFIGCQVDVTGLVMQGRGIESFRSLLQNNPEVSQDFLRQQQSLGGDPSPSRPLKVLKELSQMFSQDEAEVVKKSVRDSNISNTSMVDSKFSQSSKEDLSPHSPDLGNMGQSRRNRRIIGTELSDHDPGMAHISSQLSTNGNRTPIYSNIPALPGVYKHVSISQTSTAIFIPQISKPIEKTSTS